MKLLIDTNVILDVLIKRQTFYDNSKAVLKLCEIRKIQGFITASSVTDIFYLVRKAIKNVDETYKIIGALLNIVDVLNVNSQDVQNAFITRAKDFEDCLMAECAKSNKCSGILTYSPCLKAGDSSIYNVARLLWSYYVSATS